MKNISRVLAMAFLIAGGLQADVINLVDWDANSTDVSGWTVSSVVDGSSLVFSFSKTDEFFEEGVSDTITFDIVQNRYTGSTVSEGNVTIGTTQSTPRTVNQYHGANWMADLSTLTYSVINFTDTSDAYDVVFDSFGLLTEVNVTAPTSVTYYLGTTDAVAVSPSSDTVDLSSNPDGAYLAFTADYDDVAKVRIYGMDFSLETVAVPEPATIGMLGLGALLTMFARKFRR